MIDAKRKRLVESLSIRLDEIIGGLIPRGTRVALIDYSNHCNVGDLAIFLGELEVIKRLGLKLVYMGSISTYCKEEMLSKLKEGVILFQGGGTFGDFWQRHLRFRERVVSDFPNHKIIQLPESCYFEDSKNLAQVQKVYDAHSNLTLLLRDQASFEFAQKHFKASSYLSPDIAFALGCIPAEKKGRKICIIRQDHESSHSAEKGLEGFENIDWPEPKNTLLERVNRFIVNRPSIARRFPSFLVWFLEKLAWERFEYGCTCIRQAEIVVTDRLHGHILSVLHGVRNICLPNKGRKTRNLFHTWTKDSGVAQLAETLEEARNLMAAHEEVPV